MADFDEVVDSLTMPMGQLISSVGQGVADAQRAMDRQTIDNFKAIYAEGRAAFEDFRSIGYQPTWYAIPEVTAELAIAISVSGEQQTRLSAVPVDANYSGRFNFNLQGASKLKFRIVPVPPPTGAAAMRLAPALVGLTVGEARARLADLQLALTSTAELVDDAVIATQAPAAGELVTDSVSVTVEPDAGNEGSP